MSGSDYSMTQRRAAGALWLVAASFLILQTWLTVSLRMADGMGLAHALFEASGYFTLWTNALVAVVAGLIATGRLGRSTRWGRLIAGGTAFQIAMVGLVYHALLAGQWELTGIWVLSDFGVHTLVPVAMVAFWFWAGDVSSTGWSDAVWWLAWSSAYTLQALVRGAAIGWYPYFFLDAGKLGWGQVAINVAGLLVVFLIAGLAFVGLSKLSSLRLARRLGT